MLIFHFGPFLATLQSFRSQKPYVACRRNVVCIRLKSIAHKWWNSVQCSPDILYYSPKPFWLATLCRFLRRYHVVRNLLAIQSFLDNRHPCKKDYANVLCVTSFSKFYIVVKFKTVNFYCIGIKKCSTTSLLKYVNSRKKKKNGNIRVCKIKLKKYPL